ncbi:hypothetical protein ALON55S_06083 [Alishewanella longhuensis]
MYELSRQVIRAAEIATDGVKTLAGVAITRYDEPVITMEQHITRVNYAISYLISLPPRQLTEDLDKTYLIPPRNEEHYSALGYILFYLLPNFHFHITTAYNILRHNGVDIGKQDYLGTTKPEDNDWPDLEPSIRKTCVLSGDPFSLNRSLAIAKRYQSALHQYPQLNYFTFDLSMLAEVLAALPRYKRSMMTH